MGLVIWSSLRRHRALALTILLAGTIAAAVLPLAAAPGAGPKGTAKHAFHRHNPRRHPPEEAPDGDPSQVTVGERLFLETRFAQFFAAFLAAGGTVNADLPAGDPVVDFTITTAAPLPGPFAGRSMNCRSCHLVDEQVDLVDGGMRTYADFAPRSPVPDRGDGHATAPRNSPPLVNASLPRDGGLLLHFDGEFATLADLVRSTFTGRNFGWLPRESNDAITNLARIIREDDGLGELAQEFGGLSYRSVLTGTDPSIPAEFRLPTEFRVDVAHAGDQAIFDAVANLVSAYTEQLVFSTDDDGNFNLSPFDVFLDDNKLPRQPAHGETAEEFSRRLLKRVRQLESKGRLQFVEGNPNTPSGAFEFHPNQPFRFSTDELRGLEIFLSEPPTLPLKSAQIAAGGIGNCVACHAAPLFTDFRLHNTGATQIEYDGVHGADAFASLAIPGLALRLAHHDDYLPATPQHPDASGRFRAVPSAAAPELTDLGVWNVFANPDFPKTQATLWQVLCEEATGRTGPPPLLALAGRCSPSALLPTAIARFKTPGLRDLSHSGPYLHNGQFDTLADVIELYRSTSQLARADHLRNGDEDLKGLALRPEDIAPLVAFLQSLNEDYQ